MAQTEAQKRAKKKYQNKQPHIGFYLYPSEADILERLQTCDEPTATYIKRLIREDIAHEKENKNGN